MTEENKTGLAIYRESPIEVFLERIQPGDTADFTKYLKEKISYLSSVKGNDFEAKLIDSGFNPNDKECLEMILQRLTDGQSTSGLELSADQGLVKIAVDLKVKLDIFKKKLEKIYKNYSKSGLNMEFRDVPLFKPEGDNKTGYVILKKLNNKTLLIKQPPIWVKSGEHRHAGLDIKFYIDFAESYYTKAKCCCNYVANRTFWRDFDSAAKKYANFYAQLSIEDENKFKWLQNYLKDYLAIPEILVDKLGLKL